MVNTINENSHIYFTTAGIFFQTVPFSIATRLDSHKKKQTEIFDATLYA